MLPLLEEEIVIRSHTASPAKSRSMKQQLAEIDRKWTRRLQAVQQWGLLRSLSVLLAHSGDSWFWLLGLGLVWFFGSEIGKQRSLFLIETVLLTALVVMAIKLLVRRQRPAGEWGKFYRQTDPHSFPSGHAARAAALAVAAASAGPVGFAAVLFLWAPLVSLARVNMGLHYLSDVAAGFILGLITGLVSILIFSVA